tara:strand:+ start:77 stop:208 length:132 start_codon:yes stop_codon:yes gene_type:complete
MFPRHLHHRLRHRHGEEVVVTAGDVEEDVEGEEEVEDASLKKQ